MTNKSALHGWNAKVHTEIQRLIESGVTAANAEEQAIQIVSARRKQKIAERIASYSNLATLAVLAILAGCTREPTEERRVCSGPPSPIGQPRRWEKPDPILSKMYGEPMLLSGWEQEWYQCGHTFWRNTGAVMSARAVE